MVRYVHAGIALADEMDTGEDPHCLMISMVVTSCLDEAHRTVKSINVTSQG